MKTVILSIALIVTFLNSSFAYEGQETKYKGKYCTIVKESNLGTTLKEISTGKIIYVKFKFSSLKESENNRVN
jgi:hypothetical protein